MSVDGVMVSEIEAGLLLLVGVADTDSKDEAEWLADKVSGLRIFDDPEGKMNLSVTDTDGEILAVSQFTLLADTRKGKRPSFVHAARPDVALPMFDYFCDVLAGRGIPLSKGIFGAMMDVSLVNDGPVTIVLER